MDAIQLPPSSAEAFPIVVKMMKDAFDQHLATEGPPPGIYEQGVADGFTMALLIVQSAAGNAKGASAL